MGNVRTLIEDWIPFDEERVDVFSNEIGVATRWTNQAQLIFADKSECIRGNWTPTLSSTGSVALPNDFLRAVKDRIKWSTNWYLSEIDYPSAQIMTFGSVAYYSIWGGSLYVWNGNNGTPTVPYIKKPTVLTTTTVLSADFEIPTEYHQHLLLFLDSMMARRKKDGLKESVSLMEAFYVKCANAKSDYARKSDPAPQMEGNFF